PSPSTRCIPKSNGCPERGHGGQIPLADFSIDSLLGVALRCDAFSSSGTHLSTPRKEEGPCSYASGEPAGPFPCRAGGPPSMAGKPPAGKSGPMTVPSPLWTAGRAPGGWVITACG